MKPNSPAWWVIYLASCFLGYWLVNNCLPSKELPRQDTPKISGSLAVLRKFETSVAIVTNTTAEIKTNWVENGQLRGPTKYTTKAGKPLDARMLVTNSLLATDMELVNVALDFYAAPGSDNLSLIFSNLKEVKRPKYLPAWHRPIDYTATNLEITLNHEPYISGHSNGLWHVRFKKNK